MLFFAIFGAISVKSQILDEFADGDLSLDPRWWGQTDRFNVSEGELQLRAASDDRFAYLFLPAITSLNQTTIWSCKVRMEFAPSASNFSVFYLQASNPDLSGDQEGYYLKIGGESGSNDALELYRQDEDQSTLLLRATEGAVGADPVTVGVEVRRSDLGVWELWADYTGGDNYRLEGSFQDATYPDGAYTGLSCTFTSTRRESIFFDDFSVTPTLADVTPPEVLGISVISETELLMTLNEPVQTEGALNVANYSIDGGIGQPLSISFEPGSFNQLEIQLGQALADRTTYNLTVGGLEDFSGNMASSQSISFDYFDILPPAPGDLLINEILFNPETGGRDFIELYNASQKVLDLDGLQLINTLINSSNRQKEIKGQLLLFPGEYLALSSDPDDILERYDVPNPDQLVENDLPTLGDKVGNLTLEWSGETLDAFDYQEGFHFNLLAIKDGVSLERIDLSAPTNDPGNWHSAASAIGFATPTYQNSQFFVRSSMLDEMISIPNKRLSPDEDGFEDVLLIQYETPQTGYVLNVRIFDAQGRLVNHLLKNESLASSGTFKWDGFTNEFTKARLGIYVLWFELFDLSGKVEEKKEAVVVAGKL